METFQTSSNMKYISILRGINVSGQKKIAMKDLQLLYEELKFKNVRTYIQSGNVVFECDETNDKKLSEKISKKILSKYKFHVPVILRTKEEMENALKRNPFLKNKNADAERFYITFLAEQPSKENISKLKMFHYPPDEYVLDGKEIFLHVPISYGNSKLNNNFFESKLQVVATTRNWNTCNALVKL